MASSHHSPHQRNTPKNDPALGFIELSSISRGLYLTDVVLKRAPIHVIASQPISTGKFILLFMGDVASVEEAFSAALSQGESFILKHILIPGVHEMLSPFLETLWNKSLPEYKLTEPTEDDAIGIVESMTLAGSILAADQALKTAKVSLCRMRLGQGIGGKAYFVLKGPQEEIEAALESAEFCLKNLTSLCRVDLVARPQKEALCFF